MIPISTYVGLSMEGATEKSILIDVAEGMYSMNFDTANEYNS